MDTPLSLLTNLQRKTTFANSKMPYCSKIGATLKKKKKEKKNLLPGAIFLL